MPYAFTFDDSICIQCGICADVCPVNTLDFTRPRHAHVEDTKESVDLTTDMTEYPIQVDKCIGCMICPEECPVSCITITSADKEPKYAARQGPMLTEEPAKDEFSLSKYTKVRPTRVKSKDPWGHEYIYIPKRRKSRASTWNEKDML
ncbi:MAG: 4Fe-4S dicluster domain-containing protein [Candidatus Micrarchaeota archaeon]|nr:4Fe-4S dicluster domain-containing protein [Candidatus Micrarchaeota archaeon]